MDEIGELPLDLQAKLLRALQEKEVRPVGANHCVPVRCRILAATNRDLATMVEQGRFRKDLFYRLNVVNLRLSALCNRKDDIPLLIAHFLDRIGREHSKSFTLNDEALRLVNDYPWPGNVRELENAMERACSFASGTKIQISDLPTPLQNHWIQARQHIERPTRESAVPGHTIIPLAEQQKQTILATLEHFRGDKLAAAKLLGIGKTTLYRKLKEYGIEENAPQA